MKHAFILAVAAPLALGACAQGGDQMAATDPEVTQLRSEVDQLRAELQATQQTALVAQEQAARARQEAGVAGQRAETMFNRTLRK